MNKLYQENYRKGTYGKHLYHRNVTEFNYDNKIRDHDLMICTPNLGQNKSKIWGAFYAFNKTR